jgi:excinuclease UvrABC nuclease subunit
MTHLQVAGCAIKDRDLASQRRQLLQQLADLNQQQLPQLEQQQAAAVEAEEFERAAAIDTELQVGLGPTCCC